MKKVLIASISSLLFFLTSCGGVYTVSGGKADNAEISFVANNSSAITVMVDELEYKVQRIPQYMPSGIHIAIQLHSMIKERLYIIMLSSLVLMSIKSFNYEKNSI